MSRRTDLYACIHFFINDLLVCLQFIMRNGWLQNSSVEVIITAIMAGHWTICAVMIIFMYSIDETCTLAFISALSSNANVKIIEFGSRIRRLLDFQLRFGRIMFFFDFSLNKISWFIIKKSWGRLLILLNKTKVTYFKVWAAFLAPYFLYQRWIKS